MDGFLNLFTKGQSLEAVDCLIKAFEHPEKLSTKIDGSPAVLISGGIKELPQPFVAYKTFIGQLMKGDVSKAFTSKEDILQYFTGSRQNPHRQESFLKSFELAQSAKPGLILWGDVLFASSAEVFNQEFTPNTITYYSEDAKNKDFGIVIHTKIKDGYPENIADQISNYLKLNNDYLILGPKDLEIKFKGTWNSQGITVLKEFRKELINFSLLKDSEFLKSLRNYFKNGFWNKSEYNTDQSRWLVEKLKNIEKLKDIFIDSLTSPKLTAKIDGQLCAGEGFVIENNGLRMKLVKKEFVEANLNHIHRKKENMKLFERLNDSGDRITAWSSSKSPDLFNYYLNKTIAFGHGGGSNYLFGSYLVTEPPFSAEAAVGYSDKERLRLYGENVFEFQISTSNILFFSYDEFLRSKIGKETQASFEDFIEVQLEHLGLDWLKSEEKLRLQPLGPHEFTSGPAVNFCKIMSRYYGQGSRGNLRTPVDGFEYRGKNDGKVLVVWNFNRLIPQRYSNDMGKTWKDIDRTSPEFKNYLMDAERPNDYKRNQARNINFTYDNHPTPEKEQIYRLLLKFNSNDGVDEKGNDLRMSDGIFYQIQIHDDKTIDASYKNNLYVNEHAHYYKMKNNQFLNQIFDLGYRFNRIDCDLKIGTESGKSGTFFAFEEIPEAYWPKEITGGIKICSIEVNSEVLDNIPTKLGNKNLILANCTITEDCFDDWTVSCSVSKPSYCLDPDLLQELQAKYSCFDDLKSELPKPKIRRTKKTEMNYVDNFLKLFTESFNSKDEFIMAITSCLVDPSQMSIKDNRLYLPCDHHDKDSVLNCFKPQMLKKTGLEIMHSPTSSVSGKKSLDDGPITDKDYFFIYDGKNTFIIKEFYASGSSLAAERTEYIENLTAKLFNIYCQRGKEITVDDILYWNSQLMSGWNKENIIKQVNAFFSSSKVNKYLKSNLAVYNCARRDDIVEVYNVIKKALNYLNLGKNNDNYNQADIILYTNKALSFLNSLPRDFTPETVEGKGLDITSGFNELLRSQELILISLKKPGNHPNIEIIGDESNQVAKGFYDYRFECSSKSQECCIKFKDSQGVDYKQQIRLQVGSKTNVSLEMSGGGTNTAKMGKTTAMLKIRENIAILRDIYPPEEEPSIYEALISKNNPLDLSIRLKAFVDEQVKGHVPENKKNHACIYGLTALLKELSNRGQYLNALYQYAVRENFEEFNIWPTYIKLF